MIGYLQSRTGLVPGEWSLPDPSGLAVGVPDERRLADPGLAAYEQSRALAPASSLKQPVQHIALSGPAQKCRRALDRHALSLNPRANAHIQRFRHIRTTTPSPTQLCRNPSC